MTTDPRRATVAVVSVAGFRKLGNQRPIPVARCNIARFVEGPQRLCKEAVVQLELAVDDRPFVRINVRDPILGDREGAVAAILWHEFIGFGDEAVPMVG